MRKVKISTNTSTQFLKPEVDQFKSTQELGSNISRVGSQINTMGKRADKALTTSQSSKNSLIQDTEFDLFNSQQRDKYDKDRHTALLDDLYNKQRGTIENNNELTRDSKKYLIGNLDANVSKSVTVFDSSLNSAMTKQALLDSEVELGIHAKSQDTQSFNNTVDRMLDDQLILQSTAVSMKKEGLISVDYYESEDIMKSLGDDTLKLSEWNDMGIGETNSVSRTEALASLGDSIANDPRYSDSQQSKLQRGITIEMDKISREQDVYLGELNLMYVRNVVTQDMIDDIENAEKRRLHQQKFNNQEYRKGINSESQRISEAKQLASDKKSKVTGDIAHTRKMISFAIDGNDFETANEYLSDLSGNELEQETARIEVKREAYDRTVRGAEGKLTGGGTKIKYLPYNPSYSTDKVKLYKSTESDHYNALLTSIHLYKLRGTTSPLEDIIDNTKNKPIITGITASNSIWHEINQVTNTDQRQKLEDMMTELSVSNPDINYKLDTTGSMKIDKQLRPSLEVVTETFFPKGELDPKYGNSAGQQMYSDAMDELSMLYNADKNYFINNKDIIIERVLEPIKKVKLTDSFRASVDNTTNIPTKTQQKVSDEDILNGVY